MSFCEKVLTGLEAHKSVGGCSTESGERCPYYMPDVFMCLKKLHEDAIQLIKEQNAEIDRLHIKANESESENHKLFLRVRQLEQTNKQNEYVFREYKKRLEERTAERDAVQKDYERVRKECEKLTSEKIDVARDVRIEHETVCEQIKINNKLSEENKELKKELCKVKKENLNLIRRASCVVIEPDELDKIYCHRCPQCGTDVKFFVKLRKPVLVTGASPRKYAICPKCGNSINDFDNENACGHCGKLFDWGSEKNG